MENRKLRNSDAGKIIRNIRGLLDFLEDTYSSDCEDPLAGTNKAKHLQENDYYQPRKQRNINPCVGAIPNKVRRRSHRKAPIPLRVTVDGRLACQQPIKPRGDGIPNRPPPFYRPRYASVELRGGVHNNLCECVKRNGLQDDCPRWDCSGRPECLNGRWPECYPSESTAFFGVRKPNFEVV